MRHLLATVLHNDSNITVKTTQIHSLSWAKGTVALSDTSTHRNLLIQNINLFFHQNVFILHGKNFFSVMLLTKITAFFMWDLIKMTNKTVHFWFFFSTSHLIFHFKHGFIWHCCANDAHFMNIYYSDGNNSNSEELLFFPQ